MSRQNPTPANREARPGRSLRGAFLRAGVTVSVLGLLVTLLPTDELLEAVRSVPPGRWAVVVVLFLVAHAASAFKWRLMIRASGAHVGARGVLQAHAAGLFANLCLPSLVGGDLVRAGIAIRHGGRAGAVAVGSLADRVLDTAALAILVLAGASFLPAAGREALAAAGFTLLAAAFLGASLRTSFVKGFLGAHPRLETVGTALDTLASRPLTAAGCLGLSVAIQGALVLLNVWIAAAMSIEVGLAVWFFVWPAAKLVALLPVSLGGIGVREAALATFIGPFGVSATRAVAQSLVWETVLVCGGALAGLGSLWLGRRSPEDRKP